MYKRCAQLSEAESLVRRWETRLNWKVAVLSPKVARHSRGESGHATTDKERLTMVPFLTLVIGTSPSSRLSGFVPVHTDLTQLFTSIQRQPSGPSPKDSRSAPFFASDYMQAGGYQSFHSRVEKGASIALYCRVKFLYRAHPGCVVPNQDTQHISYFSLFLIFYVAPSYHSEQTACSHFLLGLRFGFWRQHKTPRLLRVSNDRTTCLILCRTGTRQKPKYSLAWNI